MINTREDEEGEGHEEGVSEVEEAGDEAGDVQLREEVVGAVEEHVDRRAARRQERRPPPLMVLRIKMRHEVVDIWMQ